LGEAILNGKISSSDRLGIVSDSFALSKAGLISLAQTLSLVKNFENEDNFNVWSNISENLSSVGSLFSQEDFFPHFQTLLLGLFSKIYEKVSWSSSTDTEMTKLLRPIVISQIGSNGDASVIEEAKKKFSEYIQDRNSCPPDLLSVIIKLAMRNGGEDEYLNMIKLYETSDVPEVKIKCLIGIGQVSDESLIERALEYGFSENVRVQDIIYLINACATTDKGKHATWSWVKTNWDKLSQDLSPSLLARTVTCSTQGFDTNEKAEEVRQFFSSGNTQPGIERTVEQSVETILSNASYIERERENLRNWLTTIN